MHFLFLRLFIYRFKTLETKRKKINGFGNNNFCGVSNIKYFNVSFDFE